MKIYKLYHHPTAQEYLFKNDPTKLKISELGKILDLEYLWELSPDIGNYKKILLWADKNTTMKEVLLNEEIEITKCNLL